MIENFFKADGSVVLMFFYQPPTTEDGKASMYNCCTVLQLVIACYHYTIVIHAFRHAIMMIFSFSTEPNFLTHCQIFANQICSTIYIDKSNQRTVDKA